MLATTEKGNSERGMYIVPVAVTWRPISAQVLHVLPTATGSGPALRISRRWATELLGFTSVAPSHKYSPDLQHLGFH